MSIRLTKRQKIGLGLGVLIIILVALFWLKGCKPTAEGSQISYQYTAGPNTGYRIQIEIDPVPLNPYAGARAKGRVVIMDQDGDQVHTANGGVLIHIGDRPGVSSPADQFYPGFRPTPVDDGTPYEPYYLIGSTTFGFQDSVLAETGLGGAQAGVWLAGESGKYEFVPKPDQTDSARNTSSRYLVLKNGEADFEYLNRGLSSELSSLVLTASTIERPLGEGYDLIPPVGVSREANLVKTVATIPVASSDRIRPPQVPNFFRSSDSYYYAITEEKSSSKDTVRIKVQAKALPGKSLPRNIKDEISLGIQPTYPLPSLKYAGRFADSNEQALQERFRSFAGSHVGNVKQAQRSQDHIRFGIDARPVYLDIELTGNATNLAALNLRLTARKDLQAHDNQTIRCSQALADANTKLAKDLAADPFPITCLNAFTYTYWGRGIK